MQFVELKTASDERGLGVQVPSMEPTQGADGRVAIYATCQSAVSARDVVKIIRDGYKFYVPTTAPTIGTNRVFFVGIAEAAVAAGQAGVFTIRGRGLSARFPASIDTGSDKLITAATTGAAVYAVSGESSAHRYGHAAVATIEGSGASSRNQTDVLLFGRELYL